MSRPGFKRVEPFNPTQISNCCVWLDASDTSTISLSGNNVTQWRDKSGSNNHATGVNNPTYSNGTMNFVHASQTCFTLPNGAYPSGNASAGFFVVFTNSAANNGSFTGGLIGGGQPDGTWDCWEMESYYSGGVIYWGLWSYAKSTPYSLINTNTLFCTHYNNNGGGANGILNMVVNGNVIGSPATGTGPRTQTNNNNYVGSIYRGTSYAHSGTISEVIVYSNALTTAQQQQVEGYLAQKWQFKTVLPGGHAGKTGIIYPSVRRTGTVTTASSTLPYYTQFSPTSIAGCQIWLDASDRSATSMTFSSGSNLSAWKDKSGFANTFTLTTGTTTSSNDGGYNIVTFPSGALMSSANQISYTTSSAFFLVSKVTNTGYFSYVLGFTNILSGDYGIKFLYGILTGTPGSEQYAGEFGSSNFYVNGSFNPNFGSNYYTNVYSIIDIVSPIGSGTSYVTLSDDFYGRYFAGNIAEFLYYPAGVTSAQRQTIESYLSQKWGVPLVVAPTIPAGTLPLVTNLIGTPRRNIISKGWTPLTALSSGVLPWHWFKGDSGLSTTSWTNYGTSGLTASNVGTITLTNYTQGGTQAGGTNNACTVSPSGYWRWAGTYQTSYHAIFGVFKVSSLTNGQTWTWKGNSTAGRGYTPQYRITNTSGVFTDDILSQNVFLPLSGTTIDPTTKFYNHTLVWGSNAATSLLQVGSTIASPNGWTTDNGLGIYDNEYIGYAVAPAQPTGVTMTVCEIILYAANLGYGGPVQLTPGDIANVQGYLAAKWGL